MEVLYPLIIGIVLVLALYASGVLARIGRLIGGPSRQDQLLEAYTTLTGAALEARHRLDEAALMGSSAEDRERLQRGVTRLQLALQPVLAAAPEAPGATEEGQHQTVAVDLRLLQGLQAAAAEVQRGLHAAQAGHSTAEDREKVRTALQKVAEAMVPLAVEPYARGVASAAEAFYEDCNREAGAQDDPLRELQSQLVGESYVRLFEAIQESSAELRTGKASPRRLASR